jgi:hypothetical protein
MSQDDPRCCSYYVNPPGVSTVDACVWGTKDQPVGNVSLNPLAPSFGLCAQFTNAV